MHQSLKSNFNKFENQVKNAIDTDNTFCNVAYLFAITNKSGIVIYKEQLFERNLQFYAIITYA